MNPKNYTAKNEKEITIFHKLHNEAIFINAISWDHIVYGQKIIMKIITVKIYYMLCI